MSDWLHNLLVVWIALVILACTYLVTAAIYAGVIGLAEGGRGRAFKAVLPGMLLPWGSSLPFLSRSPPRRYGATMIAPTLWSLAKLAPSEPPWCLLSVFPESRDTFAYGDPSL